MKEITEKTLLPLSLVIAVGGIIYFASKIEASVVAHDRALAEHKEELLALKTRAESYNEAVYQIKTDVAVIKSIIIKGDKK